MKLKLIPFHRTNIEDWTLARNKDTSGEELAQLANRHDTAVRAAVAGHLHCLPPVMQQLVHDPEVRVRQALAANPQCPPEVLVHLLADDHVMIRDLAILHPNMPEEYRTLHRSSS